MEAASVKARPTFIVTTKLVLDLMFKHIFWCTDLLLGLIFFNETPVMQNREREAIISVRIVCFYFIIFLSKIGLIRFESVQSRVQVKLGSIIRFKQEPFSKWLVLGCCFTACDWLLQASACSSWLLRTIKHQLISGKPPKKMRSIAQSNQFISQHAAFVANLFLFNLDE